MSLTVKARAPFDYLHATSISLVDKTLWNHKAKSIFCQEVLEQHCQETGK